MNSPITTSTSAADIVAAIRALPKTLSDDTTLGATSLAANKYYLFAAKGSFTFVVRDTSDNSVISGGEEGLVYSGTSTVPQENGQGSNTYSWVLVPFADVDWSFKIEH